MRDRIEQAKEAIAADPKKSAVLGALALVAAVMWMRSGFTMARPSSASASQTTGSEASRAGAVLASTASEIASVRERLRRREVTLPSPEGGMRDLFALSGAFPRPEAPKVTTPQLSPKSPPTSDETEAARMERERLARIDQVRTEAGRLRLRSTMVGQRPVAVIEVSGAGRPRSVVLRMGQAVDGFELVEIRTNGVLLIKDEIPVELTLEFPQQQ
ncbi:MAG: hypothetical protein ACF8QF_06380 [Phycisphaerales bacterium]